MPELDPAVRAREPLAVRLFEQLRDGTHDGVGITRASYGEGEQFAHELFAECARSLGLEASHDWAGNTFMDLPGADRSASPMVVGSHLDSVAQGGNFDGAAGVVAGLVAVAALQDAGIVPPRDIRVMAIRGEEGEWFGVPYIGSRCALGTLPVATFDDARRVDSGQTLHAHMTQAGCTPDAIRAGKTSLQPARVHGFVEIHIEQGPQLDEASIPVGLVTGIRGHIRLPSAHCSGEYSHCGGVPRSHRRDAVVAVAELVTMLDAMWDEFEAKDEDFAFTVGKLFTDPNLHGLSKIAGAAQFTLDMRSVDGDLLAKANTRLKNMADEIAVRRGVSFEFGEHVYAAPGVMATQMCGELREGLDTLAIRAMDISSGASHDAAAFAAAGIPTAMLFIRNANGSHNPHEAMAISDFMQATRVLAWWLANKLEQQ